MLPIIGVTMRVDAKTVNINKDYHQAIIQAGGIPLSIPFIQDEAALCQIVSLCDGLMLSGGEDIDPEIYGEEPHPKLLEIIPERDNLEIRVLHLFLAKDKPIFAICRGCQVLNAALGGDLFQDLPSQKKSHVNHDQKAPRGYPFHSVKIKQKSLLFQILKTEQIKVNSYHHQAAKNVILPLVATAWAADGVIEAIESMTHSFVLGVQWHPEGMAIVHDSHAKQLFSAFIEICKKNDRHKY